MLLDATAGATSLHFQASHGHTVQERPFKVSREDRNVALFGHLHRFTGCDSHDRHLLDDHLLDSDLASERIAETSMQATLSFGSSRLPDRNKASPSILWPQEQGSVHNSIPHLLTRHLHPDVNRTVGHPVLFACSNASLGQNRFSKAHSSDLDTTLDLSPWNHSASNCILLTVANCRWFLAARTSSTRPYFGYRRHWKRSTVWFVRSIPLCDTVFSCGVHRGVCSLTQDLQYECETHRTSVEASYEQFWEWRQEISNL